MTSRVSIRSLLNSPAPAMDAGLMTTARRPAYNGLSSTSSPSCQSHTFKTLSMNEYPPAPPIICKQDLDDALLLLGLSQSSLPTPASHAPKSSPISEPFSEDEDDEDMEGSSMDSSYESDTRAVSLSFESDSGEPAEAPLDGDVPPPLRKNNKYYCPEPKCAKHKGFTTKHYYLHHVRQTEGHIGQRLLRCPFQSCSATFDGRKRLQKHMNEYHPGAHGTTAARGDIPPPIEKNGRFYCPESNCRGQDGFGDIRFYVRHVREALAHVGHANFPCPVSRCTSQFTTRRSLHAHIQRSHPGPTGQTYSCPQEGCSRTYTSEESLFVHFSRTHKGPQIACPAPGCDKTYKTQRSLQSHRQKHHPPPQ